MRYVGGTKAAGAFIVMRWCTAALSFDAAVASFRTNPSQPRKPSPPPSSSSSSFGLCDRRTIWEKLVTEGVLPAALMISTGGGLPPPAKATPVSETTTTTTTTTTAIDQARTARTKGSAVEPPLMSLETAAARIGAGDEEDVFANRLRYPHPGLRRTASPVTGFGDDLEVLVDGLVRSMVTDATTPVQYGIDARIIVLRGAAAPPPLNLSPRPAGGPVVFVNPNILARSAEDTMVPWRERCLAVGTDAVWPEGEAPSAATPGSTVPSDSDSGGNNNRLLEVDLLRDEVVEVAAQDITGKPIRMALRGEASRAFQHELDHLNGILVIDHAASLEDLPPVVAFLEEGKHAERQKRAFARTTYQGNGPLYY